MSNTMRTAAGGGVDEQPGAWDHRDCPGFEGCPPRCPRFIDKVGTPLCITRGTDDVDELVDFYTEYPSRHRSMGLPPLTRPQIESWVETLVDGGESVTAFHDGDLVGHAAYVRTDNGEPELIVFVAEEYQNRGIGTELCRQILAYAAEDGYPAVRLHVSADNERALAVYRYLGFVEEDREGKRIEMRIALEEELVSELQAPPAERL